MDDIVKQAMAKWPNVPHCYGWLALDARGNWRMRDEQAQVQGLSGDKIANATLLGFINRNYTHDDAGRWYFQNGPQRVYIDLEATPYIAHTDPVHGFVLHTGERLSTIDAAWLTESGRLVLKSAGKIAMLDDRDMVQCLSQLHMNGNAIRDDQLLEWLADASPDAQPLTLCLQDREIPLHRITNDALTERFHFMTQPRSDASSIDAGNS